jgi:hypothetical protein
MKIDLRHYCRNPKCRSKLKEPVENYHKAFCARGCHSSFYLKRCLVCERPIAKKSSLREICNKPACRSAFRVNKSYYRYPGARSVAIASEVPDFIGPKWAVVAGPRPTSDQFHCATVPDGPDCRWKGGEYERIEARSRAAIDDCLTEPDWREVISPDGVRCWVAGK